MEAAIDEIGLLARSCPRVSLLVELCEHRELDRDELRDRVSVSRTTLQRNLDTLEQRGWITSTGREYRITWAGELVVEQFVELVEVVAATRRLAPILERVPPDEFDLDVDHLADGDVVLPESGDPHAMLTRHVDALATMDEARATLPFTGLHAHETVHERVVDEGARAELVVEPAVLEVFRSNPQYAPLFEEMLETGRLDVFVHEDPFPFGLAVIDGTVQLLVTEDGQPRALLETDSGDVRGWAERKLDEYRAAATPWGQRPAQ